MLAAEGNKMTATTAPWLRPHEEWNLCVIDCLLPDLADCQGKTIAGLELRARFDCTVVGIERQGFMIPLPPPETVLYPRDKVLLMGTAEQVRAGKRFLSTVSGASTAASVFEEVSMEALRVPEWSAAAGRTLGEIAPARVYGVLVAGINRGGQRILNPSAEEKLLSGDDVLALGAPDQIRGFKDWLREEPADLGEKTGKKKSAPGMARWRRGGSKSGLIRAVGLGGVRHFFCLDGFFFVRVFLGCFLELLDRLTKSAREGRKLRSAEKDEQNNQNDEEFRTTETKYSSDRIDHARTLRQRREV